MLTAVAVTFPEPGAPLDVVGEAETPTLTKEKRSLGVLVFVKFGGGKEKYLNVPSVRTERSWSTNQMPIRSSGSVSLNALAARLPIRFLVNIPWGAVLLTGTRWTGISVPEN